jgi:hypothetical protein
MCTLFNFPPLSRSRNLFLSLQFSRERVGVRETVCLRVKNGADAENFRYFLRDDGHSRMKKIPSPQPSPAVIYGKFWYEMRILRSRIASLFNILLIIYLYNYL